MEQNSSNKSIDVLLVEDNPGDIALVRRALSAVSTGVRLHVAETGVAGLEFVRRQNPRPDLIILDMNLPVKTGREVLDDLKADARFREIPVVIFSSSASMRDVRAAYRSHASTYVRKPSDIDEFFAAVAGMERYWTRTAVLPS